MIKDLLDQGRLELEAVGMSTENRTACSNERLLRPFITILNSFDPSTPVIISTAWYEFPHNPLKVTWWAAGMTEEIIPAL
jgi:hypothetical protein